MEDNMYFYYSRISTAGQNCGRQRESFKKHGFLTRENLFEDVVQGNVGFFQRPQAIKLFDAARACKQPPTVVIDSVDRLGRSTLDVLKTIEIFTAARINLKSLKEGFETLMNDNQLENPTAKLVISVMASLAEMERNKIKERQREGITLAQANGMYRGRKYGSRQTTEKLLSKYAHVVQKLKNGYSIEDVAKVTRHSTTTVVKVKRALAAAA